MVPENRKAEDQDGVNPKYPIYVVSKGRWESRLTVKALIKCNVPFRVVIEPQEFGDYAAVINPDLLLALPFSNLGFGSIPARNWIWEHALASGADRHWILDDNIKEFYRLNQNEKIILSNGSCFFWIEDFADQYENLAMAGMQYRFFAPSKNKVKQAIFNTRIYSCILIFNKIPYRWRGRYNEDTDLSLRVLKDGWCTVLYQQWLCNKIATLTMKGGNTDDLYRDDGRLKMAQSLACQHPDVVYVGRRYGRWQHVVNYRPFKKNKLVKTKTQKVKGK